MTPRIDHVVIEVGQALDDAAARWQRLGFTLTPRGHHSRGTSNHLAIFGHDYLELIGVEPARAGAAVDWGHPPGLVGLVFKTDDAVALQRALAARGVALDAAGASDLSRPVTLSDGSTRDARFLTLRLAPDAVANGRVFFCDHRTPELVWRPEWQRHPNRVTGVAEYLYVSEQPARDAATLARLFDGAVPRALADDHWCLAAGSATVGWLTPAAVATRFGEAALAPVDAARDWAKGRGLPASPDRAIALVLHCEDVEAAASVLDAAGVVSRRGADGSLQIAPADALGTTLVLRPTAAAAGA